MCQSRIGQRQNTRTIEKPSCLKSVLHALIFSITVISLLSLGTASALSASKDKPEFPEISLPDKAQGEQAIQALADKLPEVAAWYGTTPQQFADMLRQDHTAWIDEEGRLFFIDESPDPAVEEGAPEIAAGPFPYEQTFTLHSRPGAKRVIYLDFDGHVITGTAWNASYGDPINAQAYDLDGNLSSFSNSEMDRIQSIWRLVAEDYAPFDVDVTTEDPGWDAIARSNSGDDVYGTRVVMTIDNFASCGCGGFAYVGVFDYVVNSMGVDYYKPAFVFNKSLIGAAEAVSHEVGHNLGLSHDGVIGGAAYYRGHGSGATDWAPIMGVGYYAQIVQWSKGEYANANNTQDDIQIIQNNGALLLADDHGNGQTTSTALDSTTDGVTVTLSGEGLIERRTDADFFSFICGSGDISINVNPASGARVPNLDILAKLYNSSGSLIASSNPVDSLPASINVAGSPAGEYFISIDGIGVGTPSTGYTDYASLGQYTISGSAPDPGGVQYPIAVATATPPLNGFGPFTVNFFGNGSSDPDGTIVAYNWDFGDGSPSSSGTNPTHTYLAPGNYTATLTVTDNDGLTDSDTVNITVDNRAPIAIASANPTSGTVPLTVSFDSTGSSDPDDPYGMITSYSWDFGDGNSSTAANPSHTYSTVGTFTPTLTVTDDLGDTGTDTVTIIVSSSPVVDQYVTSETFVSGTVTGTYMNTFADDGVTESIRERESGGKPSNRHSYLEHVWVIPVQSGNTVTLSINAWKSNSIDGDNFVFAYSADGGTNYSDVLTISNTTDSGVVTVVLSPGTQGDVRIRVKDTDRNKGNRALDTIFVDELYITTETQPGSPPVAPTLLSADNVTSGQVDLSWMDNASDEDGFYVERSTDNGVSWDLIATVGVNVETYSDTNVTSGSTYWYQVSAYNGSGQSGYAGPINVTTPQSAIVLSANGYKDKGNKMVDLTWSGVTTSNVDIYRNGTLIVTTSNSGTYTDNLGKGGGSYTYQACESGDSNCSDTVTVNF
jgi:PKD repeat protein